MKKIIATLLVCSVIGFTANAQEQKKDASMPQMTKEQKEAMKHQREAEMNDAMTAAGLTDAQKAESKEAFEAANKAKNELKKDATLTDAQKLEKKKAKKNKNQCVCQLYQWVLSATLNNMQM